MAGEAPDVATQIAQGIEAALARREKEAKAKKDPETLAEMMDRISDMTVDKLLGKLAEGDDDDDDDTGAGGGGKPKGGTDAPVAEHPFFSPLFKGKAKSA